MNYENKKPPHYAISLKEFLRRVPWGRTKTYGLIKAGELKTHKVGRATILIPEEIEEFFRGLP